MKILGIGNAIVDVLCKVSDEFLTQHSLIKSTMKLIDEEEFKKFFRFPDEISEKFEQAHGDLCDPEMWIQLQELNQSPDSGEFFPYSEQARFNLPE